jgi:hypothetical protein
MIIERIRIAVPAAYRAPFHRSLGENRGSTTLVETEEAVVDVSPDGRQSREQWHNPKKEEEETQSQAETGTNPEPKEHHVNVVV